MFLLYTNGMNSRNEQQAKNYAASFSVDVAQWYTFMTACSAHMIDLRSVRASMHQTDSISAQGSCMLSVLIRINMSIIAILGSELIMFVG